MAKAVTRALEEERHLAVQAGTGTGKSLAYLVPAIRHAHATGGTVVVSTATIALQRQLVELDLPRLADALEPLLNRPGAFVFGTNDYWAPRPVNPLKYLVNAKREPSYVDLPWEGMRAAFVERGWRDATHQRLEFKASGVKLALAGVDDPHHDLDRYEEIAGAPNADADLAIGLLHAPYRRVLSAFEADGYDLALAGHTHGGQICLPGERVIVANSDIDRERASGLHRYGSMWMEVTGGLGTSKYAPVRIFCRPSAALIRITERRA